MCFEICALILRSTSRLGELTLNRANELLDRLERFAADGMAESPDSKVCTKIMTTYWKSGDEDALASCKLFLFNERKRRMQEGTLLVVPS
jgi:hypothetical protein